MIKMDNNNKSRKNRRKKYIKGVIAEEEAVGIL